MKKCPECLGKGEIFCPVCGGTRKDPRNKSISWTYCGGVGHIPCNICGGTGLLDDDDDYRRT